MNVWFGKEKRFFIIRGIDIIKRIFRYFVYLYIGCVFYLYYDGRVKLVINFW